MPASWSKKLQQYAAAAAADGRIWPKQAARTLPSWLRLSLKQRSLLLPRLNYRRALPEYAVVLLT
ncbi:hypothetical protein D3C73_1411320 [compost metagenome]